MPKNAQTTIHLNSFHMLARSFKLDFSSMWTENFQMYKLVLKKATNQRLNCQHLLDHRESKRIPEKNICFCFIACAKAFDCVVQLLNPAWLFATPWTVAHQAPLSMVLQARILEWFVWITTNCGKYLKRWEYQTTLPVSWETCMQVQKEQLNHTWNSGRVQNWEGNMTRLCIVLLLI